MKPEGEARRLLALIACAGLVISAGTGAKEEQQQQKEDKIVCKRQGDADIGSHFSSPKRVCRKASEWQELEDGAASAQQSLRDHGGMSGVPTGVGGGPH